MWLLQNGGTADARKELQRLKAAADDRKCTQNSLCRMEASTSEEVPNDPCCTYNGG